VPNTEYKYDLFGIVNHYGEMGRGHYTAFVKNELTSEWLSYDDSSVRPVTESTVRSRSAYILFYKRKDLTAQKANFEKVIPRLNITKFAGMPVRTKYSTKVGYLLEYREGHPCPYKVGMPSGLVLFLNAGSVQADPDSEDMSAV